MTDDITDEEYAEYELTKTFNDRFRSAPEPSAIVLSRRVSELPSDVLEELLHAVRTDNDFTKAKAEGDLAYLKHDMGFVVVRGQEYVWQIECLTSDGAMCSDGDSADDIRYLRIGHSLELDLTMIYSIPTPIGRC